MVGDRFSPATRTDQECADLEVFMTNIIQLPNERTHAAAKRAKSRRLDAAIEHAEQWHRLHLASKQSTLDLDPFRRDQVTI